METLSAGPAGVRVTSKPWRCSHSGSRAVRVGSPGHWQSLDRPEVPQAAVRTVLPLLQLTLLARGGDALAGLVSSLIALTTALMVAA
jgi:hypothetical protein